MQKGLFHPPKYKTLPFWDFLLNPQLQSQPLTYHPGTLQARRLLGDTIGSVCEGVRAGLAGAPTILVFKVWCRYWNPYALPAFACRKDLRADP